MSLELLGRLALVEPDDDRLQDPACAAVDRDDFARSRCGDHDSWKLLVFEERLSQTDAVSFGNTHGRFEVDVVHPEYGNVLHGWRIMNALFRHAADGQIESFLELY